MTAIRALSAAVLLLLAASSASAQDVDGTPPDRGSAAAGTAPAPVQPGIRVDPPKLDPKLLIDVFKRLTRPRAVPKPPPAVSFPVPTPPAAGAVPATTPVAPVVVAPATPDPAAPTPAATVPVAAPVAVTPRPVLTAKPRKAVEPVPASPVAPAVAEPPSPPVAAPTAPAAPAPEPPIAVSQAPETPAPAPSPAKPPVFFLAAGTLLPLIGLIAALAAIAAGLSFNRARRIVRTRAALSLSARLDLSLGGFSVGGLALAEPSVAIRARLDEPEARSG